MSEEWTDEHLASSLWKGRLEPVRARFLDDLARHFESASGSGEPLGPFNGGCLIVARALQSVIGGEIFAVVGGGEHEDYAMHAVVMKNGMLWDFDGPLSPEPFIERYNTFVDDPAFLVAGYRPMVEYDFCDAMESEELVCRLSEILRGALPDGIDHEIAVPARAR